MKTSTVVFYVGEDSSSLQAQPGQAGAGAGKEAAGEWEAAIKAAVMPVVKTSSSTTAGQEEQPAPVAASKEKPASASASASTAKTSEKEKEKEGRETEISQAYQIFPDEVLGSGQFGIVYGGVHR